MKNKFLLIPLAALALGINSCSDTMDYHEYSLVDKDYMELAFGNIGGMMTSLYNAVPYDFGNFSNGAMQACATDEAEYSHMGNAIEDFYNGGWTPANAKGGNWSSMYEGIMRVGRFLSDFQNLDFEELKLNADYPQQMFRYENYQYEARFLRAYFYFILVRQYGGVPIVNSDLNAEELNQLSRNTSDEVFKYIFDELDDIKDKIIVDYADLGENKLGLTQSGRANQVAVMALRAHAALYWASPLFNPTGDVERYKTAAKYGKELFDACDEIGYDLTKKYDDLWASNCYSKWTIAKELLYCRRYYKNVSGDNLVESNNFPAGFEGCKGGTCPTQNLVDAFEMKNGMRIDEPGSGYDPANPFANRDPRLAMIVARDGDVWPTSYNTPLQCYEGGVNGLPLSNATTTGYYLKKFCNGAISFAANSSYKESPHVFLNFRYAGALLDYAEAVFKAYGDFNATAEGYDMTALQALNFVRKRAGITQLKAANLDNEEFWARLQNERFVELCFEGHRFWDVRRWKEGPKYFTSITRNKVTMNDEGVVTYAPYKVDRMWNDRNYFYPIPQDQIMKNPNLKQNPGWGGNEWDSTQPSSRAN